MAIDAVNTKNATAGNADTGTARRVLDTQFQDFLKLLTTQLQNQDPTDPADVNQMTQEIATLSQVEQQINTNNSLQKLVAMFSATQMNDAVGYIGKQITASGNVGDLYNKKATFIYDLADKADKVKVTISDEKGNKVYEGNGTTFAGNNEVTWNGTNSFTGNTMPNGTYTIKVEAKDANGKDIAATTLMRGIVTSVETEDGQTKLALGDIKVPLTNVKSVRNVTVN